MTPKTGIILGLAAVIWLISPWVGAVSADEETTVGEVAFYQEQIDRLIDRYEQKTRYRSSRSEALREDAWRSALKATYCSFNRDHLVESMMVEGIRPKPYRVERYINSCFLETAEMLGLPESPPSTP
jgi:Na+-transporting NADH:ubiquinone oxidoreductase subunit NqrF